MKMSIPKLFEVLRQLQKDRKRLLRCLTKDHELAVGTVSVVNRKCGCTNCRCAQGQGHPQMLFLFKDKNGVRRCKFVRKDDETRMRKAGENYRQFRLDLMKLRAIDKKEKQILMAIKEKRAIKYNSLKD